MAKTALIIVDMVRDFTDPEGLVFYPENQKILPRIKKVLDESRKHELLIVFLQHCNRKDKVDKKAQSMRPNCIEGTFGIEIDPMLEVDEKKDYVIRKRRYSGFFGTDLDLVLRENEVENVVVVGTKTEKDDRHVEKFYRCILSELQPICYPGMCGNEFRNS